VTIVAPLAVDLAAWPGIALRIAADGTVAASNGRLEKTLGRAVVGVAVVDLLDAESSRAKWTRLAEDGCPPGQLCELIFAGVDDIAEPVACSLLRAGDDGFWLVEHPTPARLDALAREVVEVNAELSTAQRALIIERARLSRALAEVERSNRALDEFAHVVSHDLKAPLRSIANHASWLEEDLAGTLREESRAHLDRLRSRVHRMQAMIQGVLEYARAGRERAQPEPVDVGELLDAVVDLLDPPGAVEIRVEPGMPVLVTERAPLQQVFLNLIGNAVRYSTREGAQVRIGARRDDGFHEFSVADDGPGIPPRVQDRIWNLFHTLEPESGGTGIGLAVVRKLVEARGGRVWVESEAGAGATFRFRWPSGSDAPDRRRGHER